MSEKQDKRELFALLKLMRKYNLKQTEDLLKQEANLTEDLDEELLAKTPPPLPDEENPDMLFGIYEDLCNFIEESLDIYKHELSMVLYPLLVHIFIKLMDCGCEEKAHKLIEEFGPQQLYYYQNDIKVLSEIRKVSQMETCDLITALKNEKFTIRISRDSLSLFKRHTQDKRFDLVNQIVSKYFHFDLYEGAARNKEQCEATAGAITGEAKRTDNKIRVYYGLLKDIDFQSLNTPPDEEEEVDGDGIDRPKKKKPKKDPLFSKKSKLDPNAPPYDRIPLPELKDADKMEKMKAMREALKRVPLGKNSLPSCCFYTVLNGSGTVTCAEISDDSTMLALGFSDSNIKIFSLTPSKLREIKSADQLKDIDRDADDVLVRMMDDRTAESARNLYGHCGPVYRCAFSPEKVLLLSCSEDSTLRLWCMHTWTCIVVYKGHLHPIWDVRFAPHGHYFASCSMDKTARLWSTDSHQPLRIFTGHLSDVDCVQFHPNSNYIATGSSDRTVRLWDCLSGQSVRLMTGHKSTICCLSFSKCGRYLASGSSDNRVLIWDLSHGQLVAQCKHTAALHTITFSRDGTLLASGGLDCVLALWDFLKLIEDYSISSNQSSHNPEVLEGESYLLRSFSTKSSPFLNLHFTRRNLLLAVGFYKS
ncbi:transcription initiation factor TFIID subunit 5 [Condylostylus longicornis]|uniref:transcription initiation factor TFIID subunit 5 n=1 Tax=Condylostylus longicornis TaxID=2530218 RepID=UPI00244E09BC|nr:transcription initiation factor TFIID subunit 5 [Condylostylus longicornis]